MAAIDTHPAMSSNHQKTSNVQEASPTGTNTAVKIDQRQHTEAASNNIADAPAGSTVTATAVASPNSVTATYPSQAAREALFGTGIQQVAEVESQVTGTIPDWLSGTLIMNGGGDYAPMRHLFDGYGMLSKTRISNGRVWGSQRYIDTKAYRLYKQQGRVVLNEFATPPQGLTGYLQQMAAPFAALLGGSRRFSPMTDNACVSVHAVGPGAAAADAKTIHKATTATTAAKQDDGEENVRESQVLLYAVTEDPFGSYLLDPKTLQTIQQVSYPDKLPAIMQTAHPAVMADGNLLNFSRTFPFGGSHLYIQGRVTHKRAEVAYIPDRHWLAPSWMHDFASTNRHAVLIEQPLYLDFLAMIGGWDNDAVWMKWRPYEGCRIHLVTLDGSKPVQTFTCPAFSYVHCGNAYESEDGTTLHVDLAVFDSPNILNDLKLKALRSGPESGQEVTSSQYMRLDIPLEAPCHSGSFIHIKGPRPLIPDASVKHVDFVDFPSVHPALRGKPYRYVYTTCAIRPTNIGNGLAKLDLETRDVKVWHHAGGVTGEPHFIPRPHSTSEDDGVVLSSCVNEEGKAFLVVLDGVSWTEVARAQLTYATPYRFHGVWLPA